jgi:hypothetical protein
MIINLIIYKEPARGFLGQIWAFGRKKNSGKDLIIAFGKDEYLVGKYVNYPRLQRVFTIARKIFI